MKIGMVIKDLSVSGGSQKLVLRLSEQLLKAGHEVILYTFNVDKERCYPDIIKSINVISIPHHDKKRAGLFNEIKHHIFGRISSINQSHQLAELIPEDLKALIIHDKYCLYLLNWINKKNGIRIVWMLNHQLSSSFDYDLQVSTAIFGNVKKMRNLVMNIATLPQSLLHIFLIKRAVARIDEFAVYDLMNKKLIDAKIGRYATVVFAGADLDKFKTIFHIRAFAKKKVYTILSVGIFFPHRRYEDLIDAVGILKNQGVRVSVLLIGRHDQDTKYSNKIISRIKELDLEGEIRCREEVSDEEMITLYNNSDIFCFINDGFTWGISVFEAIAAGLPVIITNNIGAADIIQDKVSGFVVNPCSPHEIANAIKDIISDDTQVDSVTRTAYDTVEKLLSWKSFSERILALIHK